MLDFGCWQNLAAGRTLRWLAGSLVGMALTGTVACDKHTAVHGVVSDNEHKPLSGALVRLLRQETGDTTEMPTDQQGFFVVSMVHGAFPGRFVLTISKQGYANYGQEVEPSTTRHVKVVLTRVGGS
jgi:hypothetical protein